MMRLSVPVGSKFNHKTTYPFLTSCVIYYWINYPCWHIVYFPANRKNNLKPAT